MDIESVIQELITASLDPVKPENFIPELIRLEGSRDRKSVV